MAKKKSTSRNRSSADKFQEPELSSLEEAEEKIRLARQALREAEAVAEQMRFQHEEEFADSEDEFDFPVDELPLENLVGDILQLVKKYPVMGLSAAAAFGFFLGRMLRR